MRTRPYLAALMSYRGTSKLEDGSYSLSGMAWMSCSTLTDGSVRSFTTTTTTTTTTILITTTIIIITTTTATAAATTTTPYAHTMLGLFSRTRFKLCCS